MSEAAYDAVIVVSFGGPEGPEDVLPFLENVTRGRGIPPRRLVEVAEHYQLFGGVSPINACNRALIAALESELAAHGPRLPIYFGNRNWHPLLADTIGRMADDGIRRALALVTSAYSSYSACRQYLENIEAARTRIGERAPVIDKIRPFWNHPGYIETMVERVSEGLDAVPAARRERAHLAFTGHSIPLSMARTSDYETQLRDASDLVMQRVGAERPWQLVFQSRSGPSQMPWLEPDIVDHLEALRDRGVSDVIVVPIGFLSDHMEVVYDLDTEAARRAEEIGLNMVRAATAGTHPRFVAMLRELILERTEPDTPRLALGALGARSDECAAECCPAPRRRPSP
jgi:ferrochelatase